MRSDKQNSPRRAPSSFAIIIGGMKCGTTSLFDLLAQHPEICASRVKEPDFFVSEPDPYARWDDYLKLWDWDPDRHRIALEASTAYAKYPWVEGVPETIAASPGESFKFIYMVRDPIQRIASQVRHGLYDGWGQSLDEGLTGDLVDFSRYAMQLDRYSSLFPREDILVLTLEELKREPEAVLREASQFLGVSQHHFVEPGKARNTGDFYGVPPVIAAIARNRLAKGIIDYFLSRDARTRLRGWFARYSKTRTRGLGRWQLNEDEKARVHELLAKDLSRLRDHYGVDEYWVHGVSQEST